MGFDLHVGRSRTRLNGFPWDLVETENFAIAFVLNLGQDVGEHRHQG